MNSSTNAPSLDSPTDTAIDQSLTPALKTTATDADSDYLRYKIELCENLAMTTNCQTFDQTSSQTGWSGQDAESSTAYASGTQATYTVQSSLDKNTTYYWRSYAIDPGGTNAWSSTQGTPYSFTTINPPAPTQASMCLVEEAEDDSQMVITWSDNATDEDGYEIQRSVNSGAWANLYTYGINVVTHTDSSVSQNNTYQYRIAPFYTGPVYSEWCITALLNLGVGSIQFEGVMLE